MKTGAAFALAALIIAADMSDTVYDQYRIRLTALSTDTWLVKLIQQAGERHGWWEPERSWLRIYGRFDPDADAFVDLVFESAGPSQLFCRIEVFAVRPREERLASDIMHWSVGWAAPHTFSRRSVLAWSS